MVIPVGDSEQNLLFIRKNFQTGKLGKKAALSIETTEITPVSFVPMTGAPR